LCDLVFCGVGVLKERVDPAKIPIGPVQLLVQNGFEQGQNLPVQIIDGGGEKQQGADHPSVVGLEHFGGFQRVTQKRSSSGGSGSHKRRMNQYSGFKKKVSLITGACNKSSSLGTMKLGVENLITESTTRLAQAPLS
jgi:hypothetical protein